MELVADDDTGDGAVFVWGNAAWCWTAGDETARRLAAVQLVTTGTAGQREVAWAFAVNENTVGRWRKAYGSGGVAALAPRRRGPQGPSKLDAPTVEQIAAARDEGLDGGGRRAGGGVAELGVAGAEGPGSRRRRRCR